MATRNKASDFLRAMNPEAPQLDERPAQSKPAPPSKPAPTKPSRTELKHIGAYFERDSATVEKFAVLKVRLKMDNSELIKFAIDELHARHTAKRAYGDA